MGLLSLLSMQQGAPMLAGYSGWDTTPDARWSNVGFPQPQPMAPPAPQPAPRINAPSAQPMQSIAAPMSPLAQMPSAPNITPPRVPWSDRVNTALSSPLFMKGMALLGASQNGGDWGQAAQSWGAIDQAQQQREEQRLQRDAWREDRNWQQQERARATEQRNAVNQRYQSVLTTARRDDPELARVLEAVGPEGLAAVMAERPQYALQQRGLDLQLEEMRNNNRFRSADLALGYERLNTDRMLNSTLSGLGRDEAAYVASMRQRLDTGREIMPAVDELDNILQRRPEIFGAILEPDAETAIRKFATPGDQQAIADIQRVWTIGADFAREELRGQTPVSNLDLRVALQTGASTQQTAASMRRWIDAARRDYTRMEGQYQSALNYMQPGGANGRTRNLYEPDPVTGRNWYQDTYTNWGDRSGGTTPPPSGGNGGRAPTPEEARAELERRRRNGGGGGGARGNGAALVPQGSPLISPASMTVYQRQLWSEYQRSRNGPEGPRRHWERRARREGLIE